MSIIRPTIGLPVTFMTVKETESGKPAAQTVGTIFLRRPGEQQPDELDGGSVQMLASWFPCVSASPAYAYGKVGMLDCQEMRASSWQSSPQGAARCACGNLCAGLLATAGVRRHTRSVRLSISIGDNIPNVHVDGTLAPHQAGGWQVEQLWKVAPPILWTSDTTRDGRPYTRVRWLNDYVVVSGEGEIAPEVLRCELTCGGHQGKLIVATQSLESVSVRVFNSNGEHRGIPMTGLVTLAWLSSKVAWLAAKRSPGRIDYQNGTEILPQLSFAADKSVTFPMPTTHVFLRHHTAKGNRYD